MHQYPAEINSALDERRYKHKVRITLADSTVLTVGDDRIFKYSIDRAVSGQSSFNLGACVIGEFQLVLNNAYGDYDDVSFYGATVIPQIEAYDTDLVTSLGTLNLGVFYVDEVDTNSTRIEINCLDAMYKFDIPASSGVSWGVPITTMIASLCTAAGVTLGSTSAEILLLAQEASGMTSPSVRKPTTDELNSLTCRDVLSQTCMAMGCYAYIDFAGELRIERFNTSWLQEFDTDPEYYETHYSGMYHHLTQAKLKKFNRDERDIRITGITITSNGEEFHDTIMMPGYEDEDIISFEWPSFVNGLAMYLFGLLHGYSGVMFGGATFRPFKASHLADIRVEAGDPVLITDQFGNTYKSIILHTKYTAHDTQETECVAESTMVSQSARYTQAAQMVQALRGQALGEVLFSGDTVGAVTLSQSAADYSMLEIFYEGYNSANPQSQRIYSPDGKTIGLGIIEVGGSAQTTRIRRTSYTVSGTSITPDTTTAGYALLNSSGVSHTVGTNVIHITRVVGYR